MDRPRTILLLEYYSSETTTELVEGIAAYGRRYQQGQYRLIPANESWLYTYARRDDVDGVIAWILDRRQAARLKRIGKPLVDVHGQVEAEGIGRLMFDDRAIGRSAAEHLITCGFRRLAYLGVRAGWSRDRRQGLAEVASEMGVALPAPGRVERPVSPGSWAAMGDAPDWIRRWLAPLPRPIGVLAANDTLASNLINVALRMGLRVPGDVGVVGVDNLSWTCDLAARPISSVDRHVGRLGFEAAGLLDRLIAGQSVQTSPILVAPKGVVARHSTGAAACADSLVAEALEFIRHRACLGIQVADVASHVGSSRRLLHLRFKQVMGRAPGEEIRRVKLQRARQLLATGEMPVSRVASLAGFGSTSYLSQAFKRHTGQTPREYRDARRLGR
jgi:LacI family transcriptional regulator